MMKSHPLWLAILLLHFLGCARQNDEGYAAITIQAKTVLLDPDSVVVSGVEATAISAAARGMIPFTGTDLTNAPRSSLFSDLLASSEAWRAPTGSDLNSRIFYHGRFRRGNAEVVVLAGDSIIAILNKGMILAVANGGYRKAFQSTPLLHGSDVR